MFGSSGSKVGFIDLSKLRSGRWVGFENMPNNRVRVKYMPFNSFKVEVIENVIPNAIIPVETWFPSRFSSNMVLISGENGEAPFMEKYINSVVPDLYKEIERIINDTKISQAAMANKNLELKRSEATGLSDVTENIKNVSDSMGSQYGKYYPNVKRKTY